METRELGRSGVSVTRVILGCGNFGGVGSAPAFWGQGIPKDEAFRIMDAAWELGVSTFDTADAYGGGRSEAWIGEWIAERGVRDQIVVETKTFNPVEVGGDHGLSPERLHRQAERSLQRLGLERIPLYVAHEFDPDVAADDTLRALDELLRAGKIGAIGASNFSAGELREAVAIAEREGLARYEWAQRSLSLLDRADLDSVLPLCRELGLGYEAYGPLAGGWLTGKYRRGEEYPAGSRMTQRPEGYAGYARDDVYEALDALGREAAARGVTMPALALAWLLAEPGVTAVVVGPTRVAHLDCVREALALDLTPDESARLRGLFE